MPSPAALPFAPRAAPDPLLAARYKFYDVPPLGQGGYAVVKLAHWRKHGMDVAVKIVPKAVVEDKEKYLCVRLCSSCTGASRTGGTGPRGRGAWPTR